MGLGFGARVRVRVRVLALQRLARVRKQLLVARDGLLLPARLGLERADGLLREGREARRATLAAREARRRHVVDAGGGTERIHVGRGAQRAALPRAAPG